MIKRGDLKASKLGKQIRIRQEDLEAYIRYGSRKRQEANGRKDRCSAVLLSGKSRAGMATAFGETGCFFRQRGIGMDSCRKKNQNSPQDC